MEQLIQIPDGYEYSHMAQPILHDGGGCLTVMLKKKETIENFNSNNMKQTIEVDIPDGYEIDKRSNFAYIVYNKGIEFFIPCTKQQTRDFDWYVDQYLSTASGSTNDQLSNWIDNADLEKINYRLKAHNFQNVPWEVKIGLFKFICDTEKGSSYGEVKCIFHGKTDRLAEFTEKHLPVIPKELIEDLTKTK